jgi:mRNA-degrading endonuclease YafQ of YafQ-DinJ toxin-antitoxin module
VTLRAGVLPKVTFAALRLLRVFPEPTNHPAVAPFVTARDVKVPTDVILVWAAWSCVAEKAPIATFAALRLLRVFPEPTNHPAVAPFVTARDVKVPTDVILV